jgi:hypothetical protein
MSIKLKRRMKVLHLSSFLNNIGGYTDISKAKKSDNHL